MAWSNPGAGSSASAAFAARAISAAAAAAVAALTGSLNMFPSARKRSEMFVAEALTRRSRGSDSAPADVGEMASAACMS